MECYFGTMLKQTAFSILLSAALAFCTGSRLDKASPEIQKELQKAPYTLLISYSNECPFCIRYTTKIREIRKTLPENWNFRLIKVLPEERWDFDGIEAFSGEIIHDSAAHWCRQLDFKVYPEALILDSAARVMYKGAIDDRAHETGMNKWVKTRDYLQEAIDSIQKGKVVPRPFPAAKGCYIDHNESQ